MGLSLDHFCDSFERKTTEAALIPLVGTVAGALKVVGGAVQVISAIACAILLFIPALARGELGTLMGHSWTHLKHGLGNILAGTIEAIPLVGSVAAFLKCRYRTSQEGFAYAEMGKYMPYQSLIEEDYKNGLNS